MHNAKKGLSVMLVALLIIVMVLPVVQAGGSKLYETIKPGVPIWSSATSKSTKLRTIPDMGTVVTVVSTKTNIYGNKWYKLSDSTYVYSGNVRPHKHTATSSGKCRCGHTIFWKSSNRDGFFKVVKDNAPCWSEPTSTSGSKVLRRLSEGTYIHTTAVYKNHFGSTWYRTIKGDYVYSGNIKATQETQAFYPNMVLLDQRRYSVNFKNGERFNFGETCCGYTSLTMVINALNGDSFTPSSLYYKYPQYYRGATDYKGMTPIVKAEGLSRKQIFYSWNRTTNSERTPVISALESKKVLICLAAASKYSSEQIFTSGGHYFVINGYRKVNEIEQVLVYDPYASNYMRYDRLKQYPKSTSGACWVNLEDIYAECIRIWAISR